jgi:Flp pilus assembly protein CpaB
VPTHTTTRRARGNHAVTNANITLIIGGACLLLGIALVLLVTNDDGGSSGDGTNRIVLEAVDLLPAGTEVDSAISDDLLVERQRSAADVPSGAIAAGTPTPGLVLLRDMPAGTILTTGDLNQPSLRAGTIAIPDGMRAIAVQVPFVEGLAGYAAPGDHVDAYVTLSRSGDLGVPDTTTVLAATDVEVLDVSQQIAPLATPEGSEARSSGTSLTYLLAVTPDQASALVFNDSQGSIHLVLVGDAAAPNQSGGYTVNDSLTRPARGQRAS